MMKKFLIFLAALLAVSPALLRGDNPPVERIFISTDRGVYIAGDMVWCSLFCLDPSGHYSSLSAISYLELVSSEGTMSEAKIGLLEGRGAGSFRIPVSVPTGTYRLVAYTAANTNEEGTKWMLGSKILTIFNTFSAARVKDGVEIIGEEDFSRKENNAEVKFGNLKLSTSVRVRKGEEFTLYLGNEGPASDVSLSVFNDDGLAPSVPANSITDFMEALPGSCDVVANGTRPIEYNGEIITAKIVGNNSPVGEAPFASLSSAGAPSNVYFTAIEADHVSFYTNNIYGDRELVCDVSGMDGEVESIEFESPFINPSVGDLPKLLLSPAQKAALTMRNYSLREEKGLRLDTLATFIRHREDMFLQGTTFKRFHLDDYTRFPSVREVLVEIVPSLTVRKEKGTHSIHMAVLDASDSRVFKVSNVLVMMDGVVLSDLDLLFSFDAMLLEDIDVYQQAVICGSAVFSGVVNFITKKNYMTALTFSPKVKVLDFKGVSFPVAYLGKVPSGLKRDLRQVLYWNPSFRIGAGEERRLTLHAPDYSGKFSAIAEGLTENGSPVRIEISFDVE